MKKIFQENKKEITIISVLMIIIVIIYLISIANTTKNNSKIFENEEYIIEKENSSNDTRILKLPYINLNTKEIKKINNSIIENYYMIKENLDSTFDYMYTENNGILSLLISYSICDDSDYCNVQYDSYNIDINTNRLLNVQSVLEKYNYNTSIIDNTINQKMNEYYIYEIENNYIAKNVTFEEYLEERQLNNNGDFDIFIDKSNKLKIYKNYSLSFRMSVDNSFTENPYEFEIK